MKILAIATCTALVAGLAISQVALSEVTPAQVVAQCKKDAKSEGIPVDEIQSYVRGCLDEHGIDAADADSLMDEATPDNNEEPAQTPEDLS